MDDTMITAIMSIASTLAGTILGLVITILHEEWNKKVKFCFSFQLTEENEIKPEYRTKTSPSGYCIIVYNIGQIPFILENISLQLKSSIITDCVIPGAITLIPYNSYTYQLTEQEYNTIPYQCKQSDIDKCNTVTYNVAGTAKYEGKLDLSLPHMQSKVG